MQDLGSAGPLLISPNLFGILGDARYNVNVFDHVLHAGLAVISIGVWYLARSEPRTALVR